MANVTKEISKENTVSKIKSEIKTDITAFLITALQAEYGEDSVGMVRTGSTSKTNEIGVVVGKATNTDGTENPICITINPTVKEFANRKTDKRTYTAFDFDAARDAYDVYIAEKADKEAEAAKTKAENIARDEAKRKAKEEESNSDAE